MALNAKLTSAEANIGLYLSGVSERPLPGIVLLHEIFGVNHAMEIAADGFARAGFVVAAPDLYHAFAPGTALSYQAVDRPRAVKLKSKLRETEAVNDIAVVHHWLKRQAFCNGKVALLGFCLGGKLAALTAAADAPDCTVAFYPVHLENFLVESAASPVRSRYISARMTSTWRRSRGKSYGEPFASGRATSSSSIREPGTASTTQSGPMLFIRGLRRKPTKLHCTS
jgi:dienelactone hydrolase